MLRKAAGVSSGDSPVALVVEDDDQVRSFVTAVLEREGFRVLTASNGSDGLALCRNTPDVRVLLTDGQMGPGPTGIELAETLLKERPEIKILLISGTPEIGVLAAQRHLEFLQKPFVIRDLLQRIERLIHGKGPGRSESDRRTEMTG
jgi:CheY-like chemotaxis protein